MARRKPRPRGPQIDLAGNLGVAFVNTTGAAENNRQVGIKSYADLLSWGQQVGTLSTLEAERLGRLAAQRPADAEAAFAKAAKMRSALFRIFSAIMKGQQPPQDDLDLVNQALSEALAAGRMVHGEEGVTWGWAGDENALDRMLWPVLDSVRELVLSLKGRPHVRQCAAKDCRLFFVDRSPSGQRKWCEMKSCGHRVNSLRHYHRLGKRYRV